ncbi:MAG TPA: HEAT repeat domain-containing protein, partial [Acidimicrobiales bacterium]
RCREAAVAALGAIGDLAGLTAVLAALDDKPTVRRRATVALAGFDDPRVEPALHRAAEDRDWQVRQAAAELLDEPLPEPDHPGKGDDPAGPGAVLSRPR